MSDIDNEELKATRNIGKTADETENEIEKIIQFMIEDNYNISFISSIRSLLALYKTYLSLYNKEKEKNKIMQFKEKMLNDAFDRSWIHKDKIREFALSESQADTYNFKTISLDRLLEFLEEE